MGLNVYGQLGDGTTTDSHSPKVVSGGVTAVAAGGWHSLFRKSDGSLWAMGWNSNGQLGDGTTNDSHIPKQIVSSGVVAIAAGVYHSLFLKSDGSLWGMGFNGYGQLGDGTNSDTNQPEQIVASNVVAIATGYSHSLFLKSDGSLWGIGYNSWGQLGDGTRNSTNSPERIAAGGAGNVVAIAVGYLHSLFLKSDGSLWAMGRNSDGQLGDGTTTPFTNNPEQIVDSGVTAIAVGGWSDFSLFLKQDGSLWAMGDNRSGQLGDGTTNSVSRPVPIVPFPPIPAVLYWSISATDLLVHGTNGLAGGTYYLITSTNAALPSSQWMRVATNVPSSNGVFTITAANAFDPSAAQRFYRLQLLR